MAEGMTYEGVGVDYSAMDPFKRMAQLAARDTARNIARLNFKELEASRGESAYLIDAGDMYLAHVEEGLGTKNLVADAMYKLTGKSYYNQIAQDAVAMIVNDMITMGALPVSTAMHLAVGTSDWFDDMKRSCDLIDGWKRACDMARCTWGGGETPTLKGIVEPGTVVLSGSAIGVVKPKRNRISPNVMNGDAILFLESSGIHANGLTLARKIADKLPEGYLTKLSDGRTYGETLLDPTIIYVPVMDDLLERGVRVHYAANITGHGWRKLMRDPHPFTYVIDHLPKQLPIFDFLQEHGPVDDREAYGNFNMGAGFALFVPEEDVKMVFSLLESYPHGKRFSALLAGHVERGEKRLIIKPKGLEYLGSTLGVR